MNPRDGFFKLSIVVLAMAFTDVRLRAADWPELEHHFYDGQLAEAEKAFSAASIKAPKDDQIQFALGTVQLTRAIERLGQSLYRFGVRDDTGMRMQLPILRLPVPMNPKPSELTYADSRKIVETLIADLTKAEATLAGVHSHDVKLPIVFSKVRFDFTSSGKGNEDLLAIVNRLAGGRQNARPELGPPPEWKIVFDHGDVAWMRGYCHLLCAFGEFALAHDGLELFNRSAHLFFANVKTPFALMLQENKPGEFFVDLVDLIAMIHSIRLPVVEPNRMKSALQHLEAMLDLSKESWKHILAETDDDFEWLPNPKQKGVLGVPVRRDMTDAWLNFVDEAKELLAGKRLAPFWRGDRSRGVNIRKVFLEPTTFDLVLWIQGTAAVPYLEKGELTRPEVWNRLQNVFRGEFLGFAIWFN